MGSFLPAYQISIDNQVLQIQGDKTPSRVTGIEAQVLGM